MLSNSKKLLPRIILFCIVLSISLTLGCSQEKDPLVYKGQASPNSWPNKDLKESFVRYWLSWYSGDVEKIYSMEAPHFQELVDYSKYSRIVSRGAQNKLLNIEIYGIEKVAEHLYGIRCKTYLQSKADKKNSTSRKDYWIDLDGKWYHVIKNNILFRKAS